MPSNSLRSNEGMRASPEKPVARIRCLTFILRGAPFLMTVTAQDWVSAL